MSHGRCDQDNAPWHMPQIVIHLTDIQAAARFKALCALVVSNRVDRRQFAMHTALWRTGEDCKRETASGYVCAAQHAPDMCPAQQR
jgi:hypothetical protein